MIDLCIFFYISVWVLVWFWDVAKRAKGKCFMSGFSFGCYAILSNKTRSSKKTQILNFLFRVMTKIFRNKYIPSYQEDYLTYPGMKGT